MKIPVFPFPKFVIKLPGLRIRTIKLPATLIFLGAFVALAAVITIGRNSVAIEANSGMAIAGTGHTVVIDAGHGGADGGCVGINGEKESDINLAIALALRDILEFSGYNVVMTRDKDVSIHDESAEGLRAQKVSDMHNRRAIVDGNPDSLFVSVHQNQFTKPGVYGAQIFYTNNNPESAGIARNVQQLFRAYLDENNDREAKTIDNGLYLFKEATQPALLIECGFLSNAGDAAILSNPEKQKKIAAVIYKGIAEYYAAKAGTNSDGNAETSLAGEKEIAEETEETDVETDHENPLRMQ